MSVKPFNVNYDRRLSLSWSFALRVFFDVIEGLQARADVVSQVLVSRW